ncbi:hypothetical protein [Macrococcus sp. DPC7161]|uniref:hypothetical protein n=1 Tax=Macrococcus sp. DPC7161 TaxID=2507060 RepID=UPI00100BD9D1|nr:hypothetical protein [Macrococcus sp. DPC7161]RXK17384.1 hypothetical protein ER639_10390 [Macrococcus sp. DPC7161]
MIQYAQQLLDKISEEIKKSDNMFVYGQVNIDYENYQQLMSFIRDIILNPREYPFNTNEKNRLITFCLVNFAFYDYDDDNEITDKLFVSFLNNIKLSSKSKNINLIKNSIQSDLMNLGSLKVLENDNTRYKDSILLQNILFTDNAEKMFDIFVEIYFRYLKENGSLNNFKKFMQQLRNTSIDYLKNGYSIRTKKYTTIIQRLPKYYLYALEYSPYYVVKYTYHWIKYIHDINYGKWPVYLDKKYSALFDRVKQEQIIERRYKQPSTKASNDNYHEHKGLELKSNGMIVHVPEYQIKEENIETHKLNIFVNGEKYTTKMLEIVENEGFYSTQSMQVHIDKYSTNINYEITYLDKKENKQKVLYDSKESFSKNFLLFNEKKKFINTSTIKDKEKFYILSESPIKSIGNIDNDYLYYENGIYYFESIMSEEKVIYVDGYYISSQKPIFETGFSEDTFIKNVVLNKNDKNYKLLSKWNEFYIRLAKEEHIYDYSIEINKQLYDLSNIDFLEMKNRYGDNKEISFDFKKFMKINDIPYDEKFYEVNLVRKGSQYYVYHINIVYVGTLDYTFDRKIYKNDTHATLTKCLLNDKSILTSTNCILPLNDKGTFKLKLDREASLVFTLPTIKVNNTVNFEDKYWIEDFNLTSLETIGIDGNVVWKIGENKQLLRLGKNKKQLDNNWIEYSLARYHENFSKQSLYYNIDGDDVCLFEVIKTPEICDVIAVPFREKLSISTIYYGGKDLKIALSIPSKNIYEEKKLAPKVEFDFPDVEHIVFNIEIFKMNQFFSKEKIIIYSNSFHKGDKFLAEFERGILINAVLCNGSTIPIENTYIKFIKFTKEGNYRGKLYFENQKNNEKPIYLDSINPLTCKVRNKKKKKMFFEAVDKFGEYLILDAYTRKIHTSYDITDSKRYVIIDEFIIERR